MKMTTQTETKAQTSIAALKNANKHLSELIAQNERMSNVMTLSASDIQSIAAKCGDLQILVWEGSAYKPVSLKARLNEIAATLEKGRI